MTRWDFSERVALVTGGASGIGAATVHELRASGATVAVLDRHTHGGDGVLSFQGDVTDSAFVNAAVAAMDERFRRLDIAVCCAGIFGASLSTVDVSDAEWDRVMRINATGTFYVNRAVLPVMSRRGYGRIVNIASTAGKEGNPKAAAYSAAKAAVMALTQAIGRDVAGSGILVNCVAPAAIETPLMSSYQADLTQAQKDYMVARIPLGRLGEASEVARLITFLASEDLTFSTGAVFDISGGRAAF